VTGKILRGAPLLFGAALLASFSNIVAAAGLEGAPTPRASGAVCDDLRDRWGVEIVRLNLTAYGHMVDFRFRVLDPVKAKPLLERNVSAHLIDEATGKALAVPDAPKTGRMRNKGVPETGRVYFVLFQNQGGLLEKGDRVSVVIGDFRVEGLTVE
jgi:hypothetical protein